MDDHYLIEEELFSEELLKDDLLHIFRDTVKLPDGVTASREYVVHLGAVMIVPLIGCRDGRVPKP